LKDWVSIALLFSFLRLQFVCCCGSVSHFVASDTHAASPTVACCSHKTETNCKHSKSRCENSKHASGDCPVRSSRNAAPVGNVADDSSFFTVAHVGFCCSREGSEHEHHHHLYWLAHGNVIPPSKLTLENLYDVPSLTASNWGAYSEIRQEYAYGPSLSISPQANLLVLLGHWRI